MKDTRIQMTERMLKESLLTLLKTENIRRITVKQVCDGCGLNRSTFYLHYLDVYDLYDRIVDEFIEEIYDVLSPLFVIPSKGNYENIFKEICTFYLAHKDVFLTLFGENGNPQLILKLYNKVNEHLPLEQMNTLDKMEVLYHFSGSQSVLYSWILNHSDEPMDEIIQLLLKINTTLGYLE